ncbi:MAG: hypothetical protein Q8M87_14160 [Rhodoferax sp.]|nr:hypothetical protein [Rhodoferax sp.]
MVVVSCLYVVEGAIRQRKQGVLVKRIIAMNGRILPAFRGTRRTVGLSVNPQYVR